MHFSFYPYNSSSSLFAPREEEEEKPFTSLVCVCVCVHLGVVLRGIRRKRSLARFYFIFFLLAWRPPTEAKGSGEEFQ